MAADDVTSKHLARLRIRGAPTTIPGTSGFVGAYDARETWLNTSRALVVPLALPVTGPMLRQAFERLRAVASAQRLTVLDDPLFAIKGDPLVQPPHERPAEALLPVRGAAREDGDVKPSRLLGGMHIVTVTPRGLGDLEHLYTYLFGKFLPSRKQQLMRPYLLHRVLGGVEALDAGPGDDELSIEVAVPAVLSIKPVGYELEGGTA